ncbi:MAG TPA: sensor histidine kinase [Gaiellales bacterium]|nr:sensor histidine kinase [Gaiellales bacterium]
MEQSIRDTLGSARVRRGADTGLAIGLALLALVDLALSSDAASWGGRGPLQVCLALGCTLPLAWRVRYPIATVVAITAAGGLLVAVAAPHQAPFEVFIGSVLASYSIGAHTSGRRRWLGVGLMFGVGLPFMVAAAGNGMATGNALAPIAWLTGAWAVGAIIRGRRLRTAELEQLTAELAQQRDLQAQAAVAVERGRIARELHDVVAHNVSMMVVQAGAADRVLEGDQPDVRRALAAIAGTGRETVDEMRLLLGVVRSDAGEGLSPQPGLGDLDQLVSNVRSAGLHVDLRVEGERSPLSPGVDLSAYRIVQEALTNVLKHAESATVEVTVRYANDAVQVEVCDDGRPREPTAGGGNGLIGMRERVAMLGGEFRAGARRDGGFAVFARLPIAGPAA